MKKITLETAKQVVPMIYCYTTPEIARHNGWVKIGYTEQDVDTRINQQVKTADVIAHKEWQGNAIFEDGSAQRFTDKEFHAYLRKKKIDNKRFGDTDKQSEWFNIEAVPAKNHFRDFRENRGVLDTLDGISPYALRDEQQDAVDKTAEYFESHENGEFLWNAKPRFGKTLSVYDFCKKIEAQNVLIVTNRPAIANSWYSDYEHFVGTEAGYRFVSSTESLKEKPLCITREQYVNSLSTDGLAGCIEFVSLQDLKGSLYFGGEYDKLREVQDINWDILVIDEAHEGVDTYKTDVAFDHIKRRFTLHLSGTPFKALANDKFPEQAIFNWTYADEQRAKADWNGDGENPYANLPKLNLFTYQMSEIVSDELKQGVEINGETEEYAFDLNEFFATSGGKFTHESSVDKFLDALTQQEKFPFSTDDLRKELKHTFWLLNRVDSAKALEKKLKEHAVFKDYKIVLAAGDGKSDDDQTENTKSFDKVTKAIAENDKTITLSVGQLTTGITIPEWSAVLMLSSIKSPSLYMQAAFRAQNPCLFKNGTEFFRKRNAYVFDFDPARTLTIFEEFANDLSTETSDGRGDTDKRKENVRELLNFFPVIGEDEDGEMMELDAEKVLSIPRKIHAQEVVRRGFMSDFLFQNITNVFHAPQEVIDIIQQFAPVSEPKANANVSVTPQTADNLSLDENDEVSLSDDYVIGRSAGLFGDKIFGDVSEKLNEVISQIEEDAPKEKKDEQFEQLKKAFQAQAVAPLIDTAKQNYTNDLHTAEQNRLERKLKEESDRMVGKAVGEYNITEKKLEKEHQEALQSCITKEEKQAAVAEYHEKRTEAAEALKQALSDSVDSFVKKAGEEIVRTVETSKKEQEKKGIEDGIKDHLRGFSRTIPSFLMAYGDDTVTLDTFDRIIPNAVFKEVTSISLDDFRFLRDGGDYTDAETGEQKHFDGRLFEPVVFNDSVKEFLHKKVQLADYFDGKNAEDIFDYIPPQKTNQIFTPKWVVKKMVDMLEEENPGCFDNPDKTFIDLYMKSGLYIAEIVKRLYRSEKMKELFPNETERLKHIFEKQVYGLAPTEIIYKIATNFILGFDESIEITSHNFRQADALPYAKNGTLDLLLNDLY